MERNWKFTEDKSLAYDLNDRNFIMTGQICTDREGTPWVAVDEKHESYFEKFILSPNGTLRFKEWGELTQFNCCRSLVSQIKLLNQVISQKFNISPATLDVEVAMNQDCPFKIENLILNNNAVLNLEADLVMSHGTYHLEKQFTKYTNISQSLSQHTWTIPELFIFTVHLQMFLYAMEKEAVDPKFTLFLDVDDNVKKIIES